MNSSYWHNKVCVITGASSGLGLHISSILAALNAQVVLVARREKPLELAAKKLVDLGSEVTTLVADVTKQQDVERLVQSVDAKFGPVDLLCNCAGKSTRGSVLETSVEDFQELLDVNFLATVRMTQAFAPMLLKQRGHVVNIGSLASKVAPKYLAGYPASKFALAAYSQQLRMELGPEGLHTLLVCPGPIARQDDSARYAEQAQNLPAEANRPGGGAKLKGIDPDWLAKKILDACEQRRPELVVPWKVRLLCSLSQLSPKLGDWLLRKSTSG